MKKPDTDIQTRKTIPILHVPFLRSAKENWMTHLTNPDTQPTKEKDFSTKNNSVVRHAERR